jgi:hypothetical protein
MDWDFGDIFLTMLAFYLWFMVIWMFIGVFADIFRRHDLSGVAKAGWLFLIVVLPFLGILIYMISRPPPSPEEIEAMQAAAGGAGASAGHSVADEVTKLAELRASGAISDAEFETLKAKALAA